jgi:hypothetical protein
MTVTGSAQYEIGEELDDIEITWTDAVGEVRDFAAGWTFEFKIGLVGSAANVTKITDIVGSDGPQGPNVVISFDANDLDTIPAGEYVGQLRARRTADSKDLITQFPVTISAVIT